MGVFQQKEPKNTRRPQSWLSHWLAGGKSTDMRFSSEWSLNFVEIWLSGAWFGVHKSHTGGATGDAHTMPAFVAKVNRGLTLVRRFLQRICQRLRKGVVGWGLGRPAAPKIQQPLFETSESGDVSPGVTYATPFSRSVGVSSISVVLQ